jgi:hypothetical protein
MSSVTTDFKKEIPTYSARRGEFALVEVPPLQYLAIDGHGDPNTSPAYAEAVTSLYPLAYQLKSLSRTELGHDYVVMPLEALWWSEDLTSFTSARDASRWDWTLLIMVPHWITGGHLDAARQATARKGRAPARDRVRIERYEEGLSVQTLHIGSYDDEGPVLAAMHDDVIPSRGLRMTGKHHEIYLSDPRRTPAHRLRTILRQPVEAQT